jgi:hypothetical protein
MGRQASRSEIFKDALSRKTCPDPKNSKLKFRIKSKNTNTLSMNCNFPREEI